MIQSFYPKEEEYYDGCRTTGCSCCSTSLHTKREKDKILLEARDNIRVVKQICEHYKIPFSKFCKDILTEKQCSGHHKWYKKYEDQEVCLKCDKWKPKRLSKERRGEE